MDFKNEFIIELMECILSGADELQVKQMLDKETKALQLQQTGVMVSSLRSNFAKSREQSVKVAEINAIRHCLELYANFEVDEEVIQKAVERYRGRN